MARHVLPKPRMVSFQSSARGSHPHRVSAIFGLCLLAGCTAPVGGETTAADPGTGKGDSPPAVPHVFYAGPVTPPAPGEDQAAVYEEDFSSGLYKGHSWLINKPASVVYLRIDTFGTFTPDVRVNGQVFHRGRPIPIQTTTPVERDHGIYELVLFLENKQQGWLQDPAGLVIRSEEADGGVVSSDARYRLELLPLPAWSRVEYELDAGDKCDQGCDGPTEEVPTRASSYWSDTFPFGIQLGNEKEYFVSDVRATTSPATHSIRVAGVDRELRDVAEERYQTGWHWGGEPITEVDARIGQRVNRIEITFTADEDPFELSTLDVYAVDLRALAEELPGVPVYNFAKLTSEGKPSVLNTAPHATAGQ